METFTLSTDTLRLTFSRHNGALAGLRAVESSWDILQRPHLVLSYRLLVPLCRSDDDWMVGSRNNPVFGEKQTFSSLTLAPDGRQSQMVWDEVQFELGGALAIRVQLEARKAVWALTLQNNSPYIIENAFCPYLGDIQPPAGVEW